MTKKKRRGKKRLVAAASGYVVSDGLAEYKVGVYWACLIVVYMTIVYGFQGLIQSQPLFNFLLTAGGALAYLDVVTGILIILIGLMVLDVVSGISK